jgi:hypothetical protein
MEWNVTFAWTSSSMPFIGVPGFVYCCYYGTPNRCLDGLSFGLFLLVPSALRCLATFFPFLFASEEHVVGAFGNLLGLLLVGLEFSFCTADSTCAPGIGFGETICSSGDISEDAAAAKCAKDIR